MSGEHIWDNLSGPIVAATRRRAAIAYAGRNASRILPLGRDDIVVVDGSDTALAAGSTHPTALDEWLGAGARVWSLADLHAKVILLEHDDETRTAIVGSANISEHSNNELIEAAIITDDETVCEAVSVELDRWVGWAEPVDAAWLDRARTLYREPQRPAPAAGGRRPRIDLGAPLWLGMWTPIGEPLSAAAEAEYEQAVRRHGERGEVDWWQLDDGDESSVIPGHNVVLANNPSARDEPVGQSTAWGPAKIVRVVPGTKRHRPVAILVIDPELERHRFSYLKATVERAGGVVDWQCPLPRRAAESVYRIWFRRDTTR